MTEIAAEERLVATSLTRSFESDVIEQDGRTLVTRIVPYNTTAIVADPPDFRPYPEAFAPGAFERQLRAPDRVKVWLNFEHEKGLRGIVGHGAQLDDRSDALYGEFRVHANADGDKALALIEEKLLTGVSIEFDALRSQRIDGVVRRQRARLDAVSLCRFPAYESAQVLAMREQIEREEEDPPDEDDATEDTTTLVERLRAEKREALPLEDELTARLRSLGVAPLSRIETTSDRWDASPSRFEASEYARSCLIVREGDRPVKERASLPVLEPDGTLNTNALSHAVMQLTRGPYGVSRADKAAAARRLLRYLRVANIDAPAALVALARSA